MKTFEEYLDQKDMTVYRMSNFEICKEATNYAQEMYDLGQLKEHESNTEVTH